MPATLPEAPGRQISTPGPIRAGIAPSPWGPVLVTSTPRGIASIDLGDDPEALRATVRARFGPEVSWVDDAPDLAERVVSGFVESGSGADPLGLDIEGSPFRRRVWDALRLIPRGAPATYAEVARAIGSPGSVRAVASACAANRWALVIPCHRVVRSDGTPSGYRWGVDRKARLLAWERERAGGAPVAPPR